MKKTILFLLASLLLPAIMVAQPIQKIMGHYVNDSISSEGFSVSSSGTRSIAIILEPEELEVFQGGKIVAIRVGLSEPTKISRMFVIPVKGTKYGTRTDWECDMGDAGWNTLQLETPYDINLEEDEKLLVGFYYDQVLNVNALSFVNVGTPYDCYTYTKVGSTSKWKAINSTKNGNLSLQCIVEKDSYPDYRISAYGLKADNIVPLGDPLPFSMVVSNRGDKQIDANALELKLSIDGNQVATISNDAPFVDGYCNIHAAAPTEGIGTGNHVLTVDLVAVDGQPLDEPISQSAEFITYEQVYPRQKHLVEQLTSTYCTYCPLGNSMLNILTSQRDDIIWVGIHGNLGSGVDPFRSNQADSIMSYMTGGSISYPSGAFDRNTGWNDDVSIVNGLGYSSSAHEEVAEYLGSFFDFITATRPTFVGINADCTFDEETRMATVSVWGNMTDDFDEMMGTDARLTVYIVEDSLVAPQLNSGTWINNYTHNGVFRKAIGSIKGMPLNKTEQGKYNNVYETVIPSDWQWENLRVVAFVSRPITNYRQGFTDMYVNNAESFKFKKEGSGDITGDVNEDGEVNIADVNEVIAMILSQSSDLKGDLNGDMEVNIADVNALMDIILNN